MQKEPSFTTLLLLISFATVNAMLFTPALPDIASMLNISESRAEMTITLFLVGYACGQLIYGPIANRFGRKPALYAGVILQIISSLLCVLAGVMQQYWLLLIARLLLAIGSGVGLTMTFTLVNESYEPKAACEKISYLIPGFALVPAIGVALGGFLNVYLGWASCFYAGAIYGGIVLWRCTYLPETQPNIDKNALNIKLLIASYRAQFSNAFVITGGLLMGGCVAFAYIFVTIAPFLAISFFGLKSEQYGLLNLLASMGLLLGAFTGPILTQKYPLKKVTAIGLIIIATGVILMLTNMYFLLPALAALFLPMAIINFGSCFVLANASTLAMSHVNDKAQGSAVMNFINMSLTTVMVLSLSLFVVKPMLLPMVYLILCVMISGVYLASIHRHSKT